MPAPCQCGVDGCSLINYDPGHVPGHFKVALVESVSKSVLKARMLEFLRNVEETGEELVVTSHGKPVIRIVPYAKKATPDELFGALRGRVIYRGNLLEPTTDEWVDT